jgi:hypothetical protein
MAANVPPMHSALSRLHPFREQPWAEIASFLSGIAADHARAWMIPGLMPGPAATGRTPWGVAQSGVRTHLQVSQPQTGECARVYEVEGAQVFTSRHV